MELLHPYTVISTTAARTADDEQAKEVEYQRDQRNHRNQHEQ